VGARRGSDLVGAFRRQARLEAQESLDHPWLKMGAGLLRQVLAHLLPWPGAPVRAIGTERVPHVNDGKDARRQRYGLTGQTARIAAAVTPPMVALVYSTVAG